MSRQSGDRENLAQAFPILAEIIDWHLKGTRYGIRVDPADGLLSAGEPGVQLTWMDAKVGDWVVTPRIGKPVEINALWYNALCIMAGFRRGARPAGRALSQPRRTGPRRLRPLRRRADRRALRRDRRPVGQ